MPKIIRNSDGSYSFDCPGCGDNHTIGPSWNFNGNMDKPTFNPSLLVRSGCKSPRHKSEEGCWCTYNAEQIREGKEPSGFECYLCHSFIKEGKIQFLSDCTHELAGKTIDMPEVD